MVCREQPRLGQPKQEIWLLLDGSTRRTKCRCRARVESTPRGFATALKKLKKGKNSPDGLTAEVLQNLPLEQRSRLSTEVIRRMYTLELPEEWFESTAALAPKTAGAKHSGEISTNCEPEYHEEDIWVHVPGIASSAGVQGRDRQPSSKAVTRTLVRTCT